MKRMEIPEDYQDKLHQSMGLINSQAQTTNDESSNIQSLLQTNVSLLNYNTYDKEVLDFRNVRGSKQKHDHSYQDPKALRTKNKNKKMYQKPSEVYYKNNKAKRYLTHKPGNINKENEVISHDLKWVLENSSEKSNLNRQYSSSGGKTPKSVYDRGKELLTITVEIGNGQKEKIIIFEKDDAQQISDEFWYKHDINDELKVIFTNQIAENILQVKQEIANERSTDLVQNLKSNDYQEFSPPSIEQPLFRDIK